MDDVKSRSIVDEKHIVQNYVEQIYFQGRHPSKLFCLPFEKGSTLKGKNFIPLGVGKANRKSQKLLAL